MNNNEIKIITGEEIPLQLLEIPEPPTKLFVQGNLPNKDAKILCVVGARRYSSYGEEVTKKLISGLRGYNICIVSGLAHGIDGIAHRAALDADLQTIAFPGSGLDRSVLYPAKHHRLADEILYKGGGLISELEMTYPSISWTFPRRNRLMAGICHATLLIEASVGSGSGITTRLTLDYNRDLGAVPGNITSPLSELPNELIRDGATPVTCSDDILEMLGYDVDPSGPIQKELLLGLSEIEKRILEFLQIEPMSTDTLGSRTGLDIKTLNNIVSSMEIDNLIKERNGKFTLC
jgi:DNA processing protein